MEFTASNKLRFIPAVRSGNSIGAIKLSKSILAEWFFVIAILAITAILTTNLTLPM
tara:strand:- start:1439 stop:1606 length:168 start_codon:yes stop_codon:yes gene_type:complete